MKETFCCRQCVNPTGDMDFVVAVTHLVEKHPGRAVTYIRKLQSNRALFVSHELDIALSNREEFKNKYGTYE